MKKVLKLFVVFSMCLSQLFFAVLYSNVSAIQDDDQIVEEVDQDNTEKDTTLAKQHRMKVKIIMERR